MQAIQDLQVNMNLYPAICGYLVNLRTVALYNTLVTQLDLNPDAASFPRQKAALAQAFESYGIKNVLGITVGNEYLLNANSRGDTIQNATTTVLNGINEIKATWPGIPVGTSDTGGQFIDGVAPAVD